MLLEPLPPSHQLPMCLKRGLPSITPFLSLLTGQSVVCAMPAPFQRACHRPKTPNAQRSHSGTLARHRLNRGPRRTCTQRLRARAIVATAKPLGCDPTDPWPSNRSLLITPQTRCPDRTSCRVLRRIPRSSLAPGVRQQAQSQGKPELGASAAKACSRTCSGLASQATLTPDAQG